MKLSYRNLLVGLIITASMLVFTSSCKKGIEKNAADSHKKYSLISGTMVVDQSWIDLRNKTRNEFYFYFRDYYHTRDFLKEVEWNQAILNEDHGQKVMVFLFKTDTTIKTDARLMVIQDRNGNNHYSVRIKSKSVGGYASIYYANDKILTIGTIQNDGSFEPITQTELKTTGIPGESICYTCHHPDDDDDWGGNPGEDGINGDNWLDDVVIAGQSTGGPQFITPWPYWEGSLWVIPNPGNPNIDNSPCTTFQNLMNNPDFRAKLQQMLSNTTLTHETAFTFNGIIFSPFSSGPIGGDYVDIAMPTDTKVWGHSHYGNWAPTFTPGDLQSFFNHYNSMSNPMGFVAAVATPYGMYMLKVVDAGKFNTFGNTYLTTPGGMDNLGIYYAGWGIFQGTNTGDNLPGLLNALQSGLSIQKIQDPNIADLDCN